MGIAPLVSVAIALAVLDEPFRLALVGGAALIVAGGIALAGERVRPTDFRHYGTSSRSGRRCSSPCATTSCAGSPATRTRTRC